VQIEKSPIQHCNKPEKVSSLANPKGTGRALSLAIVSPSSFSPTAKAFVASSSRPSRPTTIGMLDIAGRIQLPPDRLSFAVTLFMSERLLGLADGQIFLGKPFLQTPHSARATAGC
jgi:hypothetical protein